MVSYLLTVDLGLQHLLLLFPHVLLQLQGLLEKRHQTSEAAAAAPVHQHLPLFFLPPS